MLRIIDKKIEEGILTEDVIVQAGHTKYRSDKMKIFDYVSQKEFDNYMKECSFLITHCGVGSIFNGLKYNKKIMAMARLSEYGEQHNNHQLELIEEFTQSGYILSFEDEETFDIAFKKLDDFKPKKYVSNTNNMIELIEDFIENN